jgi:hypothetical protein
MKASNCYLEVGYAKCAKIGTFRALPWPFRARLNQQRPLLYIIAESTEDRYLSIVCERIEGDRLIAPIQIMVEGAKN